MNPKNNIFIKLLKAVCGYFIIYFILYFFSEDYYCE